MNLRRWMILPALLSISVLPACSSDDGDDSTVAGSTPEATATSTANPVPTFTEGGDSNPGAAGGDVTVHIKNFAYSPASFEISRGQVITFINDDGAAHTATSSAGQPESFDSGDMPKGKKFNFAPVTLGTYNFICTYHQYMKASFTVK